MHQVQNYVQNIFLTTVFNSFLILKTMIFVSKLKAKINFK